MVSDAIAAAAGVAASEVRRATMLRGDLAVVAEAAMRGGSSALAAFRLEVGCAARADARPVGELRRRGPRGARRPGRLRGEARRRAHPDPQARRGGAPLHALARRRHRAPRPRRRRRRALARALARRRRRDPVVRLHRRQRCGGRTAPALPGDRVALRPRRERRPTRRRRASVRRSSSSTRCTSTASTSSTARTPSDVRRSRLSSRPRGSSIASSPPTPPRRRPSSTA